MAAGDHVPAIPLVEDVGKIGVGEPEQIGPIALNVGVVKGVIVTVLVIGTAHCPTAGVNV
jgi:hypothetical protein